MFGVSNYAENCSLDMQDIAEDVDMQDDPNVEAEDASVDVVTLTIAEVSTSLGRSALSLCMRLAFLSILLVLASLLVLSLAL